MTIWHKLLIRGEIDQGRRGIGSEKETGIEEEIGDRNGSEVGEVSERAGAMKAVGVEA